MVHTSDKLVNQPPGHLVTRKTAAGMATGLGGGVSAVVIVQALANQMQIELDPLLASAIGAGVTWLAQTYGNWRARERAQ